MTESADARAPGDAARAFLAALNERRWDDAAAMVLPKVAAHSREMELGMLIAIASRIAAGEALRGSFGFATDSMYDEEAVRRVAHVPAPGYRGISTLGELIALTPVEFMARTLENVMENASGTTRLELLDESVESDTTAYTRVRFIGNETDKDTQATFRVDLRQEGGRWYVEPEPVILGMGSRALWMALPQLGGPQPM
jgi:hypothetical protein